MFRKFLDTNAILTDCSNLSDVILSSKTLEELENIKSSSHKDNDIKYKARVAVRAIREQKPEIVVVQKSDYDKISAECTAWKQKYNSLKAVYDKVLTKIEELVKATK